MNRRQRHLLVCIPCCLLLLTFCSSTKSTSVWKDDTYSGGPLKKVLVVGVFENSEKKRMFEEAFVREFKGKGVEAVSSVSTLSPHEKPDKEVIKREAQKLGIETIFVTHLMGIEQKTESYPVTSYGSPRGPGFGVYYIWVCKVDAHNLMHFLRLRMAADAQAEIRAYAQAIYEHFFKPVLPWTAEA